jgi:hypothetical protein
LGFDCSKTFRTAGYQQVFRFQRIEKGVDRRRRNGTEFFRRHGCNSGGTVGSDKRSRIDAVFRESEVSPRNRIFDDQIRLALMLLSDAGVLPKCTRRGISVLIKTRPIISRGPSNARLSECRDKKTCEEKILAGSLEKVRLLDVFGWKPLGPWVIVNLTLSPSFSVYIRHSGLLSNEQTRLHPMPLDETKPFLLLNHLTFQFLVITQTS